MKMKYCGIYQITNLIPNERTSICKVYIGSSIDLGSRKKEHFSDLKNNIHSNRHLQNSYNKIKNKLGSDKIKEYFKFEVIQEVDKVKELLKWEQHHLDKYKINDKIDKNRCYNLSPTAGNTLGYRFTKEQKLKVSKGQMGRVFSEETRKKIGKGNKGKTISAEVRKRISDSLKGEKNYNYGKSMSEEHKVKMSIAHKGKKLSEEHKIKLSLAHKGRKVSEETRKKMSMAQMGNKKNLGHKASEETRRKISASSLNKRRVLNLDTDEIFESITEASKKYNVSVSCIIGACKGVQSTSAGYRWMYY